MAGGDSDPSTQAAGQPGPAASGSSGTPSAASAWVKDKACRVCDSLGFFKAAMKSTGGAGEGQRGAHSAAGSIAGAGTPSQAEASGATTAQPQHATPRGSTIDSSEEAGPMPCPPDYFELGNSTWTFLHSVAAYYPDAPSEAERSAAAALMRSLGQLYPCGSCAEHLRHELERRPPAVSSRAEFEAWLCSLHNEVNVRLGKPAFDCARVGERWRDGPADGSCG